MRTHTNMALEFNVIRERLSEYALSQKAKEKLLLIEPFLSEGLCKSKMTETTEARKILETLGNPPLSSMNELDVILDHTQKGVMLTPEQLGGIASFLHSCKRMKNYLKKAETLNVALGYYGSSFVDVPALYDAIDQSIRNGVVDDNASPSLRNIRRKMENTGTAIKSKLETILRGKKEWFADGYVTMRNGRFVLPVKKGYKNQINGLVVDTSGTGGTYFIEPASVRKLQAELEALQIEEENEVRRILYSLTALVHEHLDLLVINRDCMETLDFAFAKAKLSVDMKAIPTPITTERSIRIVGGRHPLLKQDTCVPLDFEIGGAKNGVVITGPNTGGKTVVLKTVGLLSLMAQSGLHVPVLEGSVFCMHNAVLCDIGDGQSITENLSTFSSHITNIVEILNNVTNESLVLLDELGSGTDPTEGMGIAIAILDELSRKGCLFLATTHYPEIKDFANRTKGLVNARMEFDKDKLVPLFTLTIGEAGESCALYIAQRLGFPEHLLNRATKEAYGIGKPTHSDSTPHTTPALASKIQKEEPKNTKTLRSETFQIGDSVRVYPQKAVGIVYERANEKGELGVQIKGKKQWVNHKRVKLIAPASELYPDDYDFSILFDTVKNRKARRVMDKKHDPNAIIHYEEGTKH